MESSFGPKQIDPSALGRTDSGVPSEQRIATVIFS
jgi:hypothetical protein